MEVEGEKEEEEEEGVDAEEEEDESIIVGGRRSSCRRALRDATRLIGRFESGINGNSNTNSALGEAVEMDCELDGREEEEEEEGVQPPPCCKICNNLVVL